MKRIVIVGGGFGGATLAKSLVGDMPEGWEVVLVSEESYTTYNPMLPEVVGATLFPEHVVAPLRQVIGTHKAGRFIMGRVTAVDRAAKEIHFATLSGETSLGYDHLVLAVGNRARLDLMPGMAEHALPVKTVGDALHIRNVVLRRLAQMELESDEATSRKLGHFVVIGGGFSGVEVAGAIIDYVKGVRKYYRHVPLDHLTVTVLHDGDRLLPELPASLGAAALRILTKHGVNVRLLTGAAELRADCVKLRTGEEVPTMNIIGTIGNTPNALVAALNLPTERGRLTVDAVMRAHEDPSIWALGDCAWMTNAHDGKICPPTAQFAVRQALALACNLKAAVRGKPLTPFRYRPRGSMAAIGHLNGVAEVFGLHFNGLIAWFLWRAYYLAQMPTFGRKLRIYVEWTWGMMFSSDITHLRFTRSDEAA